MCIDAKSARCWKYSPADNHTHFPPGLTFQPNRIAVDTGLSFINTLCTRSEDSLPILMENNKNHQITLPKGRIVFSSLDVADQDEPKYQIRCPHELSSILMSDTMIAFSHTQQSQLRAGTNFYRSSMVQKIQSSNNLIQMDIAYPQTPE